jgi:hypothetical protein
VSAITLLNRDSGTLVYKEKRETETEVSNKTWTVRAIEDGGTGRVETGLTHEQAVAAIDRASRGLNPFETERSAPRAAAIETVSRELATPVAA